ASGMSCGSMDEVYAYRRRAGMLDIPAGLSKEEFEKRYRNERRVELAFEEHRIFDVRRWKILDKTDRLVTGMRIQQQANEKTYTRFKFTNRGSSSDKFLLYPIDQTEINKVFELTGQNWQNPGWLD